MWTVHWMIWLADWLTDGLYEWTNEWMNTIHNPMWVRSVCVRLLSLHEFTVAKICYMDGMCVYNKDARTQTFATYTIHSPNHPSGTAKEHTTFYISLWFENFRYKSRNIQHLKSQTYSHTHGRMWTHLDTGTHTHTHHAVADHVRIWLNFLSQIELLFRIYN